MRLRYEHLKKFEEYFDLPYHLLLYKIQEKYKTSKYSENMIKKWQAKKKFKAFRKLNPTELEEKMQKLRDMHK